MPVISNTLMQVSVGSRSEVWGVDAANHIYRFQSPDNWVSWTQTQIAGSLKQVSVAADGTVMGVNSVNDIYRYNGDNSWSQVSGKLAQISVGSASLVWGVSPEGNVYRYLGGNAWTQIPGLLKQVSVSVDGIVMGVNSAGTAFLYEESGNHWIQLPGHGLGCRSEPGPGTFTLVVAANSPHLFALDPLDPDCNRWRWALGFSCWYSYGKGTHTYISIANDQTWGQIDNGVTTILGYIPE